MGVIHPLSLVDVKIRCLNDISLMDWNLNAPKDRGSQSEFGIFCRFSFFADKYNIGTKG